MRLAEGRARLRPTRLTLPYRIAGMRFDAADIVTLILRDDGGREGYGAATPVPKLSGDDGPAAEAALREAMLPALAGRDLSDLDACLERAAAAAPGCRGALAALDIALHDLHAKARGQPLVELLGGARRRLFTSITLGLGEPEAMAEAARRHAAAGFRAIKVKIGEDATRDREALRRIRAASGEQMAIRVDVNEGYGAEGTLGLGRELASLRIELVEQPAAAGDLEGLRRATRELPMPVVADESVRTAADLAPLTAARAARGANIKLMKCGGLAEARRIDAALAGAGWKGLIGCMDESCAGIAAAAHFAAAAISAAWIDLDGHLDLESDPFRGGIELARGELVLSRQPGLGVQPALVD
ncbi:MAG TPA: enolase C-terminal domain-like protein [Candidatus Polarisedimenticolia bacterium]|nr:enolase C-terminal domain-like protein [Candidatus Polarisedimenticolia bacterium]